jgi:hypothetical protein
MKRIEIILFSVAGALILGALVITAVNKDNATIAQVLITLALAICTFFFAQRAMEIARATREQADASHKMAQEMANQRYVTVRPVIDITMTPLSDAALARQIYLPIQQLKLPDNILCKLSNIGIGPAIDVYYYTSQQDKKQVKRELGVLKINEETDDLLLYVEQRNEESLLTVYYKDIYGRTFKSTRKALITEEKIYKLGPLNTTLAEEEKTND